jgi:hypothetical protein
MLLLLQATHCCSRLLLAGLLAALSCSCCAVLWLADCSRLLFAKPSQLCLKLLNFGCILLALLLQLLPQKCTPCSCPLQLPLQLQLPHAAVAAAAAAAPMPNALQPPPYSTLAAASALLLHALLQVHSSPDQPQHPPDCSVQQPQLLRQPARCYAAQALQQRLQQQG